MLRFFAKKGDTRLQLVLRACFSSLVFVAIIVYGWRATPIPAFIAKTDTYHISAGMVAFFSYAYLYTMWCIAYVARELSIVHEYLRLRIAHKNATSRRLDRLFDADRFVRARQNSLVYEVYDVLRAIPYDRHHRDILEIIAEALDEKVARVALHSNTLVKIGFLGTLIGMMLAISGIDFGALLSKDAGASTSLRTLGENLGTAIGTSIVGVVGTVWLSYLGSTLAEGVRHLTMNLMKMEMYDDTKDSP